MRRRIMGRLVARARPSPAWEDDREGREGGAMIVEFVIAFPLILAMILTVMDAGLFFHARAVAIAAAQEGARAAAAQRATAGAGTAAARSFIDDAGGQDVFEAWTVTGNRSATTASVTVTGTALGLLPGLRLPVRQSATVPVERLTR